MRSQRIAWVDNWKGLLIFLVVLGHMSGAMSHGYDGFTKVSLEYIYKFIYIFHMPAFFFLAGLMWGEKKEFSWRSFAYKRAKRLLIPYLFWGVISILIFLSLRGLLVGLGNDGYYNSKMFDFQWWQPFVSLVHAGGWPNGEGFRCNSVLWFLPCMFVTVFAYEMIMRRHFPVWAKVMIAVVLAAGGGAIRIYANYNYPFGLGVAVRYLSFMMIGGILADIIKQRAFHWMPIFVGWCAFAGVVSQLPDMYWAWCRWSGFLTEYALAVVGCVLSLLTAQALPGSMRLLPALGRLSLGIMVVHKFLLLAVQIVIGKLALFNWIFVDIAAILLSLTIATGAFALANIIKKFAPLTIGE